MEMALIIQSVRRKLNIFQKHQYFKCPKKLAQYMDSFRPVSESLYFKDTYWINCMAFRFLSLAAPHHKISPVIF
jgi:hypothetical protein